MKSVDYNFESPGSVVKVSVLLALFLLIGSAVTASTNADLRCGYESGFIDEEAMALITLSGDAGIISGEELFCSGYDPVEIISHTDPDPAYSNFSWEESTDGVTWTIITGASGLSYDPPAISVTKYFRRLATNTTLGATRASNIVTKTVDPAHLVCLDSPEFANTCENSLSKGQIGTGIKGVANPRMRTYNASFLDLHVVEVVFSGGAGAPSSIMIRNTLGDTAYVNAINFEGETGTNANRYFVTTFAPSDSIMVEYDGDANLAESLTVFTYQESNQYEVFNNVIHQSLAPGESYSKTYNFATLTDERNLYASGAISGLLSSGTEVEVRVEAGAQLVVDTITTFTNQNSLELFYANIEDIDVNVNTATITITALSSNVKDVLLAGILSAGFTCDKEIVITAEGPLECAEVGATMTFSYTVYNFADVELTNVRASSSLGGDIDLGTTTMAPGAIITVTQDYVVQESDITGITLVNDVFAAGWNFAAFGFKPRNDDFIDVFSVCEICDNGFDDDNDGLIDCFDPDCPGYLTLNLNDRLYDFNLVVEETVSFQGGGFGGAVAMGGDLLIESSMVVAGNEASSFYGNNETNPVGLYIGGAVQYLSGGVVQVNSDSYLKLKDLTGSTVHVRDNNNALTNTRVTADEYLDQPMIQMQNRQNSASPKRDTTYNIQAVFELSRTVSALLSEKQTTNSIVITGAAATIDLYDNQENVVTITGSDLSALTSFTISNNISQSTPLIINIDAPGSSSIALPAFAGINSSDAAFVILNFYNATNLTFTGGGSSIGAILAPDADVVKSMTGNINGQVIAKSFVMQAGEVISYPLDFDISVGCLPEICDNGIDDDGNGSADSDDLTCYSCEDGILLNPGFEDGAANWTSYGNFTVESEVNGNKYAKVSGGEGGFGQYADIAEGDTINLTFYGRISGPTKITVGFSFYDTDLVHVGDEHVVEVDTSVYQQYTVTFVAPADVAYVKAFSYKNTPIGEAYLDGFCLRVTESCTGAPGDCQNPACVAGFDLQVTTTANVICGDETVTLTATGAEDYQWSTGATTASIEVSPNSTTTYEVYGYYVSGYCADTASVEITVSTIPNALSTIPLPITCDRPTATLTANPNNMSYQWSTGATSRAITVNTPGAYNLTVTNQDGCSAEAVGYVVDNTAGPSVDLDDFEICTQPVELKPILCENYGDFTAKRILQRNGWNNTIGEPGVALVGDGEFCFTIDSLKDGTIQMIGLNSDPATNRSFNTIDYAIYVYARENLSQYRLYIRESGTQRSYPLNTTTSYVGSELCVRRTGTTIDYLKDGVILYTSTVASTQDLYIDNSFHSTTSKTNAWYGGYSRFTNISLCGELEMAEYNWSTGETTSSISTNQIGTYTVTVTDGFGCTSTATSVVSSKATDLATSIDYNGNVCVSTNAQISGLTTGGVAPYTYEWTGPNSYTADTETITITDNGNYYMTVTDAEGCTASTSGYVYEAYQPTIVTLQTEVCEGESVSLSVNSSTATDYQWSANAGGLTSPNVTVYPSAPSSTYYVTVTSDLGCTAVAEATLDANPVPTTDAGSNVTICDGQSVTLTASVPSQGTAPYDFAWSGGAGSGRSTTFTPSGSSLTNVTNTYTVTVTDDNGCSSTDDVNVTIHSTPAVTLTQQSAQCGASDGSITWSIYDHPNRSHINLSINGGVDWIYVADDVGNYEFTGLAPGTYDTRVRWGDNSCPVDIADITVESDAKPIVQITGDDQLCVGDYTTLSPSSGGLWLSSDSDVATVSTTGIVSAVSEGSVTFTFTSSATGCVSDPTSAVTVSPAGTVTMTGDQNICSGATTTMAVSQGGGTFSSSDESIATVDNNGVVTGVAGGVVTITYRHGISPCIPNPTVDIAIMDRPVVTYSTTDEICVGDYATVTPATGGVWTSTNESVASITNNGVITGLAAGTTRFQFLNGSSGCLSELSAVFTVTDVPTVALDFNGSECLTDSSKLSTIMSGGTAPYSYLWQLPDGSTSDQDILEIDQNGAYYVTATDSKGCESSTSGYVYQQYEAFIINLESEVCEGEEVELVASASNGSSYLWSSNAGGSSAPSATVTPTVPSSEYFVTITNAQGCQAVASASIDVIADPTVSVTGANVICQGETSSLSPTSGGIWTSTDPTVASVSYNGIVTGVSAGVANFIFTDLTTGCESSDPVVITVRDNPTPSFAGPLEICQGEGTSVLPSTGGTWTSTNDAVATIDNTGNITAVGPGVVTFVFEDAATGCSAGVGQNLVVNGLPSIVVNTAVPLCIGGSTNAFPSTGGIWTSSDESVATISNVGVITAVSPGKAAFTYTNVINGCSSEPSDSITVSPDPTVSVTGSDSICIGENTTLSPSTGGTWESSNPAVAQVNNSGVIMAMSPGVASFRFTDAATGCQSVFTSDITVIPSPIISVIGDNSICVGETSYLSPSTGGTWASNNTNIATTTADGIITAITGGTVTFTFTSEGNGCGSATSEPITVFNQPIITLDGPDEICVGTSTSLQPSSGGIWSSSDNSIATISISGQVTGISPGNVTFTYTETGSDCSSEESLSVSIVPQPVATVEGSNTLCVGSNTTLSPTTGGIWVSSAPAVATVTSIGVVTAVSQGLARFTFISDAGCISNETLPVIVIGDPQASLVDGNTTCVGTTLTIQPSTGGTWTSSDESVATVTNAGIITGVNPGTATFTFVDAATGCSSGPSEIVTIQAGPTASVTGSDDLCVGQTTSLAPTVGGVWMSSDPTVATVDNNGLVTAISAGSASFVFTEIATGCIAEAVGPVVVESGPAIAFTGSTELCIGGTSNITASEVGTWTSTNPSVATITSSGVITAVAQGIARFIFTETSTGCQSELSGALTVNAPPSVSVAGSGMICIAGTGQLLPSTGGTWESMDTDIATITNTGVITGVSSGTVTLRYMDTTTGCTSLPVTVQVVEPIAVGIAGEDNICQGGYTTLFPASGGVWTSSNPAIATVTNEGLVLGKASGQVTFTFTDSNSGCSEQSTTDPIMVSKCTNHDFNVTTVALPITSTIARNDAAPVGTTYSNAYTTNAKPSGSVSSLVITPEGEYTFSANKPGKYIYSVPVCVPPAEFGCHKSLLEITVIDDIYSKSNVVTNLDMAETYAGAGHTFDLKGQANDHCVSVGGCSIDYAGMTIVDMPTKGVVSAHVDGSSNYVPMAGVIGKDTIKYRLCPEGVGPCTETFQIINVKDVTAANGIYASDDFNWAMKDNTITGNVLTNDGDAEGDAMTVTAEGSASNPIPTAGGAYYIEASGAYTFVPEAGFAGYAEIPYTVCDDNATDMACTSATVHILVFDDLTLRLKVYLEGALIGTDGDETADGRPRMRDDLRVNKFDGKNYIPTADPYSFATSPILDFTSQYTHVGAGLLTENQFITDSVGVFSVTGDDAIVDWVFVDIRSKDDMATTLATRSGLLQRDGDVVDLDGVSPLRFKNVSADSFYVVVKHRSHLAAMSMLVGNGEMVDFTDTDTDQYNFGTSQSSIDYTGLSQNTSIKPGYNALWGGDFNSDGLIKFTNPDDDHNWLFFDVLLFSDNNTGAINYNFGYGYHNGDFNMDGRVKYTNPDDDTNYLFFQVLLYPQNTSFFSNYSFMVEQVPSRR